MAPTRLDSSDLASALPPGGRTLVLGCSGESLILVDAVMRAGPALGPMTFTGIFVPGLNKHTYLANPACRMETFFVTPELKAAGAAVTFLPLCYSDILARLQTIEIDAALFMTTEPDSSGACSFGSTVDFLAELWPRIPVRIAHINPLTPRTRGRGVIPFSHLTAFTEREQPLLTLPDVVDDGTSAFVSINSAIEVDLLGQGYAEIRARQSADRYRRAQSSQRPGRSLGEICGEVLREDKGGGIGQT